MKRFILLAFFSYMPSALACYLCPDQIFEELSKSFSEVQNVKLATAPGWDSRTMKYFVSFEVASMPAKTVLGMMEFNQMTCALEKSYGFSEAFAIKRD